MSMESIRTIGPSLPAGAAFGGDCGAPSDERAGHSCPNGHSIRSGDTYCWSCGAAIPPDVWVDATACPSVSPDDWMPNSSDRYELRDGQTAAWTNHANTGVQDGRASPLVDVDRIKSA